MSIRFGDVTLLLVEGRAEAEITVGENLPIRVAIAPSSVGRNINGFGERPYVLCFIPVWNGIIISDALPNSSNWPDRVNFIPKATNGNINDEINAAFFPPRSPTPPPYRSHGDSPDHHHSEEQIR